MEKIAVNIIIIGGASIGDLYIRIMDRYQCAKSIVANIPQYHNVARSTISSSFFLFFSFSFHFYLLSLSLSLSISDVILRSSTIKRTGH